MNCVKSDYYTVVRMIFVVFDELVRRGMLGFELGRRMLSKLVFSATVGRGNRFPCGRTRVPSVLVSKNGIFERRNRFPIWRNRVPPLLFEKNSKL